MPFLFRLDCVGEDGKEVRSEWHCRLISLGLRRRGRQGEERT